MRLLLAISLIASLATFAAAGPPKPAPAAAHATHDDDCARARAQHRTCVLTIGGEDVGGTLVAPKGSTIEAIKLAQQSSLIRIRRDFIAEIVHSADQL